MTASRGTAVAALLLTLLVGACSSAGSSPGSSSTPSASPSESGAPGAGGSVTTPDEAVAAVVAAEPRFAGIGPKDPQLIGQSQWYEVAPASGVGAFVVRMTIGWGDCQAGCIEKHTWTYAVAPDGGVRLIAEDGSPVPSGELPDGSAPAAT